MQKFVVTLLLMCSPVLAQSEPELSKADIEKRVRAMKKPDVAWRKIAWKTSLVDALHTSREQKKPIVAWVFIDRPKDDERC